MCLCCFVSGDGTPTLDDDEMAWVLKIMPLLLKIHQKQMLRRHWARELMNMVVKLLVLSFCLWIGHLAVKGDENALLLVAICDKGDKLYKIASAIKTIVFG